jgi:SulP family sulfate permease
MSQVSRLDIRPTEVDWKRLKAAGYEFTREVPGMKVVYVSGSLFFGAASQFMDAIEKLQPSPVLILSMRGVPVMDVSGLHAIEHIWHLQLKNGGLLFITGLQSQVQRLFEHSGLIEGIGPDKILWSADQAITKGGMLLARNRTEEWRGDHHMDEADREEELEVAEIPFGVVKME